jgi:hypothetical protein
MSAIPAAKRFDDIVVGASVMPMVVSGNAVQF